MWPHGLWPARLVCPWDSPGKRTGAGCHALLQGIFPTQGSNPCLWCLPALAGRFLTPGAAWKAHKKQEHPTKPTSPSGSGGGRPGSLVTRPSGLVTPLAGVSAGLCHHSFFCFLNVPLLPSIHSLERIDIYRYSLMRASLFCPVGKPNCVQVLTV